ncbi:kinase-like domain-containing protein [Geopyxis carbonaria]|nr:kinase-like domain-containing protein [Geopyxis carbonaria]
MLAMVRDQIAAAAATPPTGDTPTSNDPVKEIRKGVSTLRINNSNGRYFVPRKSLKNLLTESLVKGALIQITNTPTSPRIERESINNILVLKYKTIRSLYACILALLIRVGMEDWIVQFFERSWSDEKLPLSKDQLRELGGEALANCGLYDEQYEYLAPVFEKKYVISEGEWSTEIVLPFTKENPLRRGGYGSVYKVQLHPEYDDLEGTDSNSKEGTFYARKELAYHVGDEEKKLEFTAATMVRHRNICPLLAAYRYGDKYNMIFPFADCNLREYWETKEAPIGRTHQRMEFLTEIAALAKGLRRIHNAQCQEDGETLRGYHRDLKPTNIVNKDQKFMITDFGMTRFKQFSLKSLRREGSAGSGIPFESGLATYRAPECGEARKAGRAADIWSLGCIFAEVMAYVVLGINGPAEFSEKRSVKGRDWFHDGKKLKAAVEDFFQELEEKDKNDSFIKNWLDLIRLMLKTDQVMRPNVEQVIKKLEDTLKKESAIMEALSNGDGLRNTGSRQRQMGAPDIASDPSESSGSPSLPHTVFQDGAVPDPPDSYKTPPQPPAIPIITQTPSETPATSSRLGIWGQFGQMVRGLGISREGSPISSFRPQFSKPSATDPVVPQTNRNNLEVRQRTRANSQPALTSQTSPPMQTSHSYQPDQEPYVMRVEVCNPASSMVPVWSCTASFYGSCFCSC